MARETLEGLQGMGYEVVVRILAEDVAEAAGHGVDGGEVSDDETFDMEPLF